ncbi:MAG: ATP-grasp protein [Herminiimonas sp.]|nr:ATP-grasp protein [Herminiimonas sp.]MDB5853671.1 ATP-grasp protein [Herminiimonas sp.]
MLNILVVGKSRYVVVAVLQSIRSFGPAHTVVIGDNETRALQWSTVCDMQHTIDFDGPCDASFVHTVNRFASDFADAVLLPADCDGVRITNRVRNRLNITIAPIPTASSLKMFDDKWLFYQFCTGHGFRVPTTRFIGCKNRQDYDAIAAEFSVPFVVKPTNRAGSIGVQIITDRDDFAGKILLNEAYDFDSLIVQRYIDGTDIDLSLLSLDGTVSAFAVQRVVGSRVEFIPNTYLETVAAEICSRSGYNGVMHIDARMDRETGLVYLIEANPRFWASLAAATLCGLNFVAESVAPTRLTKSHAALKLTSGDASCRHPALQPACWKTMTTDSGYRGRLLRAKAFDPYSLGQLALELSESSMRYARNKTFALAKSRAYQKA